MMNNHCRTIRNTIFCFVCIGFLINVKPLFAQQNFTPLQRGEYEIVKEDNSYDPHAQFSGEYKAHYYFKKLGLFSGDDLGGDIFQDFYLQVQSKVNSNVSFKIKLGNKSDLVSEQESEYDSRYKIEAGDSSSDEGLTVVFKEAYLEYNHNPNARLLLGKQDINIADRKGLVFDGSATAITQGCRIGTWCYYIGAAKIGDEGESSLYWAQLLYPIYQSGIKIPDPWGEKSVRQQESLSIEIFRTIHQGHDIPLAVYGGWVGENTTYHDTTGDAASGERVYYDNSDVEYFGFNVKWAYYDFLLDFLWMNQSGTREYHTGTQENGDVTELSNSNFYGNAYLLNTQYLISDEWKSSFTYFWGSGNSNETDGQKIWESDSAAYYEVKKGGFGDALIYFNGDEGVGDGHSVSNLRFHKIQADYQTPKKDVLLEMSAYWFYRNSPVFINTVGEAEDKGSDIGFEFDFRTTWQLERNLSFQFFAGLFMPKEAYTVNDSVRPIDTEDFSMAGLHVQYNF